MERYSNLYQYEHEIAMLNSEINILRANYNELICAICRKYGGETQHQTALRYIRQSEGYECPKCGKMKGEETK